MGRMKAKVALLTLSVAVLLFPTVSNSLANEQKTLVGLPGVHVLTIVESPKAKEIELLGLTKDQVQKDVELRLRKSGIKVLTDKEWLSTTGTPSLMVSLSAFSYLGVWAYSIRVALFEVVTLARGGQASAPIWESDYLGLVGTNNIRQVRDDIGDKVDEFINDYLAANPK
jgi:hypothetical protein